MSKNSAGKVYFVLYLAVILELLIIIVERDEAEEHLRKREREAREIVQDILGQMQVGPGNENLTSRINDEISLLSDEAIQISGIPYKKYRTYNIEVGVNDGSGVNIGVERKDTLEHLALLKRLTNAQMVEYEVLFTPSSAAEVPSDEPDGGNIWKRVAAMSLHLDTNAMTSWQQPLYKANNAEILQQFTPTLNGSQQAFVYNAEETEKSVIAKNGKYTKRVFTTNFQPTQAGWYKLRFSSRTNRIMGVSGDAASLEEISDDAKVNIGSMQLTVRKLRKVQALLQRELEMFHVPSMEECIAAQSEEAVKAFFAHIDSAKSAVRTEKRSPSQAQEICRKIDLYADVAKLLAPNKSQYFAQNAGGMEINIRVTKPPVAIVKANVALPKEVYVFDKLKPAFSFTAGPFYGNNTPKGEIIAQDGTTTPLAIERTEQLADASNTVALQKGQSIAFKAKALQNLKPGTYTIRVAHSSQGDQTTEEAVLRVFPSQLTASSRRTVEGRMKSLFYGSTLSIMLDPDAEGKVPASEFRTYLALNNSTSNNAVTGLAAKLPMTANAKSASVRLTWISPFTGEEVEILPKVEQSIKQREPDIDLTKAVVTGIAGDWQELKVQVGGIQVSPGIIDVGGKTGTYETLSDVSLAGVSLTETQDVELTDYTLREVGDGLYTAIFTVRSVLPKAPKEMIASIKFSIAAAMRNPMNGTRSGTASWETTLPFSYQVPAKKGKK